MNGINRPVTHLANPTMHRTNIPQCTVLVTEMCTFLLQHGGIHVHIFVATWCIVGYLPNALWDL